MARLRKYVDDIKDMTSEKEAFICEQLAQLKRPCEIIKLYTEQYPDRKPLCPEHITYYHKTRKEIIEKLKDKYLSNLMDVPIANEKIRLERTERLYQASTTLLNKKDMIGSSLACLKEAREETKGESPITQTYLQFNQYNELSDAQLVAKEKELRKQIIELSKKEGEAFVRTD